jgi:hypothetical protein
MKYLTFYTKNAALTPMSFNFAGGIFHKNFWNNFFLLFLWSKNNVLRFFSIVWYHKLVFSSHWSRNKGNILCKIGNKIIIFDLIITINSLHLLFWDNIRTKQKILDIVSFLPHERAWSSLMPSRVLSFHYYLHQSWCK